MGRKSYPVARMLFRVNNLLQKPNISFAEKKAMCMLMECVLHDTGNYCGFMSRRNKCERPDEYSRTYFVSNKIRDDYNIWKEKDGWKYE